MTNTDLLRAVVCLLAIDGTISRPELQFLQKLRQHLGVSDDVLAQAIKLAGQGKGRVPLSENPADMKRLFVLLVTAAITDNTVTREERRVLNAVGAKMGLAAREVEHFVHLKLAPRQTGPEDDASPPTPHQEEASPEPAEENRAAAPKQVSRETVHIQRYILRIRHNAGHRLELIAQNLSERELDWFVQEISTYLETRGSRTR